jgi:uncharacterized membrane protein
MEEELWPRLGLAMAHSGLYLGENHALLWERGMVTDLGNLGGTGGIGGNHACAINN